MNICKTCARIPLVRGNIYRRLDVFPTLEKAEIMSGVYFDPLLNELFVFLKENDDKFDNRINNNTFSYRSRSGDSLTETPAWERTKIRNIFFQRAGQADGDFEYIGTSLDENNTRNANGEIMEKQYIIL